MTTIVSDTSARERIARIIDPDAWHETLRTDGCGEYWMGRRAKALAKADAILASLPSPEGEWVLVPREPTEALEREFASKLSDALAIGYRRAGGIARISRGHNGAAIIRNIATLEAAALFRAMLSATPSSDGER